MKKERICEICKSEGKIKKAVGYISYPNMRRLRMELCRTHKDNFPEMDREKYANFAKKIKEINESKDFEDVTPSFINLTPCDLPRNI
jgi:hypothetical protein